MTQPARADAQDRYQGNQTDLDQGVTSLLHHAEQASRVPWFR